MQVLRIALLAFQPAQRIEVVPQADWWFKAYVIATGAIAAFTLCTLVVIWRQHLGATAAARTVQQRNARALRDLAARIRNSLGQLDADAPRDNQLRAFNQVNESDVSRLQVYASQIDNNAAILAAESEAVGAIREILATVEEVKRIHPGAGWPMQPGQIERWRSARQDSNRGLQQIENECNGMLNPRAGV